MKKVILNEATPMKTSKHVYNTVNTKKSYEQHERVTQIGPEKAHRRTISN